MGSSPTGVPRGAKPTCANRPRRYSPSLNQPSLPHRSTLLIRRSLVRIQPGALGESPAPAVPRGATRPDREEDMSQDMSWDLRAGSRRMKFEQVGAVGAVRVGRGSRARVKLRVLVHAAGLLGVRSRAVVLVAARRQGGLPDAHLAWFVIDASANTHRTRRDSPRSAQRS
jgi:hypothetical protein